MLMIACVVMITIVGTLVVIIISPLLILIIVVNIRYYYTFAVVRYFDKSTSDSYYELDCLVRVGVVAFLSEKHRA